MTISPATMITLHIYSDAPQPSPASPSPATTSTDPEDPSLSLPFSTHPVHTYTIPNPFFTLRALSEAPFVVPYTHDHPFILSADEFFEDNPLIAATLQPQTEQRYSFALDNFANSTAASDRSPLSLDQRLSIYIQERFLSDSRPGQRQEMSNLLCMLLIMYPTLRQELGIARRCLSGWKVLKPSRAAAPLTTKLVQAFVWHLLSHRKPQAATILLFTFSACLRVSEALHLTWEHVALPGDVRLSSYEQGIAGINIRDAKTARYSGHLQFVKLTEPATIQFLSTLQRQPHQPEDKIAAISYDTYTAHLKSMASYFGFSDGVFTSHSGRIGKATEDYLQGTPVDQIAINGRWKNINSLRYYLNNGKAWILNNAVSTTHQYKIRLAAHHFQLLLHNSQSLPSV